MLDLYVENNTFEKEDFSTNRLEKGEYDRCTFKSCNFSESLLNEIRFTDCTFENCNLSLAQLNMTSFQLTNFIGCKMLGLKFENCSQFGLSFSFEHCQMDHCSFFKTKARGTRFSNVQLREADFTECDLTESVFHNCDLLHAVFERTNLEKVDFRTANNYAINPNTNRIKKAKFSLAGLPGLLSMYNIIIEQ